jgi:hypothetical protein
MELSAMSTGTWTRIAFCGVQRLQQRIISIAAMRTISTNIAKLFSISLTKDSSSRQANFLEKACRVAIFLIRNQIPWTLHRICDIFFLLIERGRIEVVNSLRFYMRDTAKSTLGTDHPLYQIYTLISLADVDTLQHLLSETWQCAIDSFGKRLGHFQHNNVVSQVDLIDRVYGIKDCVQAETRLSNLLSDCEIGAGHTTRNTLYILSRMGWLHLSQSNPYEAKAVGRDLVRRALRIKKLTYANNGLELVARAHHASAKHPSAERTLQIAIDMVERYCGTKDPWWMRSMLLLEGWLREWQRYDDAEELQADIDRIMGEDEDGWTM